MLNSREWATLILIGATAVVLVVVPKWRRRYGPMALAVLRAFWVAKVAGLFIAMFVWIAGCLTIGWLLHVRSWDLLKDAVIITLVLAIPILFRLNNAKSGGAIVRDLVREAIGITTLLAFYLNLETFPLWAELLLQPFITVVALCFAVAGTKKEWRPLQAIFGFLLLLVLVGSIIWTTVSLLRDWPNLDGEGVLLEFALSIWLPALLFPFFYGVAFLMVAESLIVRLAWLRAKRRQLPFGIALAVIFGVRLRVSLAARFDGRYNALANASGYREARGLMRDYRQDLKRRDAAEHDRVEALKENSGRTGTDADGAQLDRREFQVTKSRLEWISVTQMGRYEGNGNRYWNDLTDTMVDAPKYGLPENHGLVVETTADGQKWRGWRVLPSGWVLGMGGSGPRSEWQYAGGEPPTTWPGDGDPRWVDTTREPELQPDWVKNDEPLN
ncbi:MAG TPA: hypothetical protein VGM94_11185 [Galbitalea sp.]|jgi:hypothetical protein